jgi:hypothetical protein
MVLTHRPTKKTARVPMIRDAILFLLLRFFFINIKIDPSFPLIFPKNPGNIPAGQ